MLNSRFIIAMEWIQVVTKYFWTKGRRRLHKTIMLAPAFFLASLFIGDPADAGTIKSVSASSDHIVVQFDDVVNKASVFALAGPNRVAIDIAGATAGGQISGEGAFKQIRQGQFDADTARLVLDLDYPVKVSRGAFSSDGKTLTLSIVPSTAAGFLDWLGLGKIDFTPPEMFRSKPKQSRYEVSAPIGKGGAARGLPKIYGPADARLPLVVIDAGHGGHDPGAISPHGGAREKDVTLAIARAVRDELVKTGRVRVALSREGDSFIVLQDRYGIARKLKADLFMSIHADSAENQTARGGSVYTLSEVASDREAQKLAARENKSDIINGINLGGADVNVSSILIDLTQRETMNVSAGFAKLLLREAGPNLTLRSNAHHFASFIVLKAPDTPSVLFETGYLSNAQDAQFLTSASGRQSIARSVSSAVQAHFARRLALD
jgi:N-acetylmuramoyl-L-alanine amidase